MRIRNEEYVRICNEECVRICEVSLLVAVVVMFMTQTVGGAESPSGGVEKGVRDNTGAKGSEGGHEKGAFRFPHPESAEVNARDKARRWYRVWERVHRPQVSARKIGRLQCRRLMLVARKLGGPVKCSAFVIRRALLLGALIICRARRWMFRGIFCGGGTPGNSGYERTG